MKRAPAHFSSASSPSPKPISSLLLSQNCLNYLQNLHHAKPFSSSSSHGRRPKKKIYHREPDLDKVMDLQKKPSLILHLRELILSRHGRPLLLRDLEKEVGFVKKWAFMELIQRQPAIFKVSGGASPVSVHLTEAAETISRGEPAARSAMEPLLVRNLSKLLMMSLDCCLPMSKIELLREDLGLPADYSNSLLPRYPSSFSRRAIDGQDCLCLESWDSSAAITAREERLSKTGPFSFQLSYPAGFRPNRRYLEEVAKWQKMEFPSPYLSARSFSPATPAARKRAVAVLHEVLSLTMEKRLSSDKLDAFHDEYQLPCKLLLCLVKNHGMFYITNKGGRSTVFLKEGYVGRHLRDKCPLLRFYDRFLALSGRSPCCSETLKWETPEPIM
ncbi:protein WHAT'S THIS FACTOR 1 homolog, chloroplastic-like [Wolffia australiana]